MPRVRSVTLVLASILLAACAEAPPPEPQQPPSSPPGAFSASPREVTPVDAEMLKIAGSEEQIDRLFPHAGVVGKSGPAKKGGDQRDGEKAAPLANGGEDPCAV